MVTQETGCSLDEVFPGQVLDVHDAYHRFKSITHLHNAFPGMRVRSTLNKALEKDDASKRDNLFARLEVKATGDKRLEKILKKETKYICNHWDSMVLSMRDDIPGSFTEPMVQHLAQRFTSIPSAWKTKSCYNLLAYKIFLENSGRMEDIDSAPRVGTRLEQFRKAQAERSFIEEHVDFSLFDPVPDPIDGNSATRHLMHIMGHGGALQF